MSLHKRQILLTSALPYANGPIHLGHVLEVIQADIWVRFQKMRGHTCYYVCAEDAHGTPIMLSAQKQNMDPVQLIERVKTEHQRDFKGFLIGFDYYHTTHSEETREFVEYIYLKLKSGEHIESKTIQQLYDPIAKVFLPDRFVKGECPKCASPNQHGDNCDACGATYAPTDLKNPVSVMSGALPILRSSLHYFFKLQKFESFLKTWLQTGPVSEEVHHKLLEWFKEGLQNWDISRDAPYFGFEIPDVKNKYFYVWLDAPVGYMASFKAYCKQNPSLNFDDFWEMDSSNQTELYHLIGKDIVYFHALFWPAMLEGAGFRKPSKIFVHGFVTVNGQKMSKSKGTFITAEDYLKHLSPEALRYYFAVKSTPHLSDLDFNCEDFTTRVNSDLVGKFVNIASRSARFIETYFQNQLAYAVNTELLVEFRTKANQIAAYYEAREFQKAMREIMALADRANQWIDEQKPWNLIKQTEHKEQVHSICSTGLNLFKILTVYLKPVLPELAKNVETFLNISPLVWGDEENLLSSSIHSYQPLFVRIDQKVVETLLTPAPVTEQQHTITLDDFAKIDLRVAQIIHAEAIPEADKLLKLTVDLGTETRTIFAGIKSAYPPEALIGKHTVIVANLAPRKMRFGTSYGMVLAAGSGDGNLWLLEPDSGAKPGMKIK